MNMDKLHYFIFFRAKRFFCDFNDDSPLSFEK